MTADANPDAAALVERASAFYEELCLNRTAILDLRSLLAARDQRIAELRQDGETALDAMNQAMNERDRHVVKLQVAEARLAELERELAEAHAGRLAEAIKVSSQLDALAAARTERS